VTTSYEIFLETNLYTEYYFAICTISGKFVNKKLLGHFFVFYHIVFINMLDWISNIQYGSSFTQSKCRVM